MSNKLTVSQSNQKEIASLVRELSLYLDRSNVRTILELGSRDAEVSIALKQTFPNATVYAFECNPPALDLCRQNIAASGLHEIHLIPKAVSDSNGTLDFYAIDPEKTVTPHADGNIGASSLFKANPDYPFEQYHQNKISVQATTLADWALEAGVSHIDLIWMDLQGAELNALHGMGSLLQHVHIVYTEVEFKPMYLNQPLFTDIDGFLRQNGFILRKQFNRSDWFGDVMYVQRSMSPSLLRRLKRKLGWK